MNIASVLCNFIGAVLLTKAALTVVDAGYQYSAEPKVYRVIATTKAQLEDLSNLQQQFQYGVSFWNPVKYLNIPIDMIISPEVETKILSILKEKHISYGISPEGFNPRSGSGSDEIEEGYGVIKSLGVDESTAINWTSYQRLDTIYNWLDELAETYPDCVKIVVIGHSYEGRPIKGIKITFNENNPGIFFEGGIHAREWISPAVVTYLTNEILTSKNETFNKIARSINWFIFPVTNPDGYEYSHTTDRRWRKTRHPYANDCYGADPNRNFDYFWLSNAGASTNSCDDEYAGPEPFSEIEVKSLADYIASVVNDFYIFLSIHNYGQTILLPYGYTEAHLDNFDEMMYAGNKSAAALASRYGTNFTVGGIAEIYYADCGTSTDYVKGVYNTTFVYCYELRDTNAGPYYFELPEDQIIPSALEFIDALVALVEATRELGYGLPPADSYWK